MSERNLIVPEKIIEQVKLKGFYLYKWLTVRNLSDSIKKDFLNLFSKNWDKCIIFFIFLSIVSILFLNNIFLLYFLISLFLVIFSLIFLFLLFISIKKSYFLLQNTYLIITSNHIIINSKIFNLGDFKKIDLELRKIESIFDNKIFSIENKKINHIQELKNILTSGYNKIYNKKIGSVVLPILVLYFFNSIFIILLYFVGLFFISIFSLFLAFLNKIILLQVGHKIININNSFIKIDNFGYKLNIDATKMNNLLEEAKEGNWEQDFLTKINKKIKNINSFTIKNIKQIEKLRNQISNSKYNNIYDFDVYNIWLKNEIYKPIFRIKELLLISKTEIDNHLKELQIVLKSDDVVNKSIIEKQIFILNLQNKYIYDKIGMLDIYLQKLLF